MLIKYLFLFILSLFLGLTPFFVYNKLTFKQSTRFNNTAAKPSTQASFDPAQPPTQSLKGKILSFSGSVQWQSRIATDSAQLTSAIPIQQGESLETGDTGRVSVEFPNILSFSLTPSSKVDFAQTLPENIAILQSKGQVGYQSLAKNYISVRALHLLIDQLDLGGFSVTVDPDQGRVGVTSVKGSLTAAYNDSQNTTKELTVAQGQSLIFNDDKRIVTVK